MGSNQSVSSSRGGQLPSKNASSSLPSLHPPSSFHPSLHIQHHSSNRYPSIPFHVHKSSANRMNTMSGRRMNVFMNSSSVQQQQIYSNDLDMYLVSQIAKCLGVRLLPFSYNFPTSFSCTLDFSVLSLSFSWIFFFLFS